MTAAPSPPPASRRAPGRPRQFDRDAALATALDLFWRHGFEGTSTKDLSDAMGVAPPSLYAAFGSKEALYLEAVASYRATHGRVLRDALEAEADTRLGFERMLLAAARQFTRPGQPPGCMVSYAALQTAGAHEALQQCLAAQRGGARELMGARLAQAVRQGELPADTDTGALARYFAATVQGMAVQARDGAGHGELCDLASIAMRAWPARPPGP